MKMLRAWALAALLLAPPAAFAGIVEPVGSDAVTPQGPYPTPIAGSAQHNLAITSSTGLNVPTGAVYATVQAATATVKYSTDLNVTPTSSVGMTLAVGASLGVPGQTLMKSIRFISATGTLDIEYFR
jgi:hypothetical protein